MGLQNHPNPLIRNFFIPTLAENPHCELNGNGAMTFCKIKKKNIYILLNLVVKQKLKNTNNKLVK